LFEPLKTCAGRKAVRKNTNRLDVVTLDLKDKLAAFIWSIEVKLFDSMRAVPVPQPVGGTLVFAVNSTRAFLIMESLSTPLGKRTSPRTS
jgi:hypothetical protein